MTMADTIRGPVTRVVDGDTFEMDVTHIGKENTEKYNNSETVRIAGIDAPELGTEAGKKAKAQLDKKLSGKEVRCTVQARDTYGRVVADIEIL
jgi:micrococcal nuclease